MTGGRQSPVAGRRSAVSSRQSAVGSRQSAVGSRQSAVEFTQVTFSRRSLFLFFFIAVLGVTTLPRLANATAFLLTYIQNAQSNSDASLATVRSQDRLARNAKGTITRLTPEEHLRRAASTTPTAPSMRRANIGKALMNYYPTTRVWRKHSWALADRNFQERQYNEAYSAYDRLARSYPSSKEGREGLNFQRCSLLRLGKTSEAADRYIEYINRFPEGKELRLPTSTQSTP